MTTNTGTFGGPILSAVVSVAFLLFAGLALCPAFAFTEEELNTIGIYERVAPAVVNITTMTCEPEFFFCPVPPTTGSGSGIVLKAEGLIVTSFHLVDNAESVQVGLSDGRRLVARVVASSPADDLTLIRVDPGDRPLQEIVLGNSESLKVGQKVLAIGNPFGLGQTLTVGVVSMLGRSIRRDGRIFRDVIQTDASINPGNSGGALVDSSGELIGMNTAILSTTGSSIGIGFAVPVNRIKAVTPGLAANYGRPLGWLLAFVIVLWTVRKIVRL